jgi:hypothetical protein
LALLAEGSNARRRASAHLRRLGQIHPARGVVEQAQPYAALEFGNAAQDGQGCRIMRLGGRP